MYRISPNKCAGRGGTKWTLTLIWFPWNWPCDLLNTLTLSAENMIKIGSLVPEILPKSKVGGTFIWRNMVLVHYGENERMSCSNEPRNEQLLGNYLPLRNAICSLVPLIPLREAPSPLNFNADRDFLEGPDYTISKPLQKHDSKSFFVINISSPNVPVVFIDMS